jgi:hypothetical protein
MSWIKTIEDEETMVVVVEVAADATGLLYECFGLQM